MPNTICRRKRTTFWIQSPNQTLIPQLANRTILWLVSHMGQVKPQVIPKVLTWTIKLTCPDWSQQVEMTIMMLTIINSISMAFLKSLKGLNTTSTLSVGLMLLQESKIQPSKVRMSGWSTQLQVLALKWKWTKLIQMKMAPKAEEPTLIRRRPSILILDMELKCRGCLQPT